MTVNELYRYLAGLPSDVEIFLEIDGYSFAPELEYDEDEKYLLFKIKESK